MSEHQPTSKDAFTICLMSFGHRHGLPEVADLVLDARILPNPHYEPELQPKTGIEPDVASYVLDNSQGTRFMALLLPLLELEIGVYRQMGKGEITIAMGCTGGRHRSVATSVALAEYFREQGYWVDLHHRDMEKL
jgi:UPF0042 nucleotide-binding protein